MNTNSPCHCELIQAKILDIPGFLERKKTLPADYALVFTNGCFDILHPGHVDLLARARDLGDGLMVGLNSDESVRRLGKGADRPVNPLADRALVLAGLGCVDFVIPFDQDTPLDLIKAVRPRILVKGGDWPVESIVGREAVESDGGTVLSLSLKGGYSTTFLLDQIRSLKKY